MNNKLEYIHAMEQYHATKRKELLIYPATWIYFADDMLSKRSNAKRKYTVYVILFI